MNGKIILYRDDEDNWKQIGEGQERERPENKQILFEVRHSYTFCDEDYAYDLIVEKDGSLYIRQSETEGYRPTVTIIQKEKSDILKVQIEKILEKYRCHIDKIGSFGKGSRGCFSGILFNKEFSYMSLSDYNYIKSLAREVIKKMEELYPGEVDWDISIKREMGF